MPFCKDVVRYRACVPQFSALSPTFDTKTKDDWVASAFSRIVATRKRIETNDTLQSLGVNELGNEGEVAVRFTDNPDCENAYKNFFCWLNFPRCDEEQRSLILCRSVCENSFESCNYDKEMWRCGPPEYYGGASPELDDVLDANGLPVYWRAQFPGQPFRDNAFDEDGNALAVCTPSIKNGAPPARQTTLGVWMLHTVLALLAVVLARL